MNRGKWLISAFAAGGPLALATLLIGSGVVGLAHTLVNSPTKIGFMMAGGVLFVIAFLEWSIARRLGPFDEARRDIEDRFGKHKGEVQSQLARNREDFEEHISKIVSDRLRDLAEIEARDRRELINEIRKDWKADVDRALMVGDGLASTFSVTLNEVRAMATEMRAERLRLDTMEKDLAEIKLSVDSLRDWRTKLGR